MCEEGGYEVAEEGLSMGGFSAEMAVFEVAARHGECIEVIRREADSESVLYFMP